MSKLSYEDKLNIYYEIKNGKTRKSLSIKYKIGTDKIDYLVRLVDKHGLDIFRTTKNRKFNYYSLFSFISVFISNIY